MKGHLKLRLKEYRIQSLWKVLFFPISSHNYFYENSSRFFFTLSALGGFYSSDNEKARILKHETVTLGGFYSSDNEKARILKHETVTF